VEAAHSFEVFLKAFTGYFELELGPQDLAPSTRLVEDLGFDSIAMFELILLLEDLAGFEIPEQVASDLKDLGDVHHYTAAYLTAPSG
jgi:acyl carrier protein